MLAFILMIQDDKKRSFLSELFEQHSKVMYHIAYDVLRNRSDAEDAVQETFIKIYHHIDRFYEITRDETRLLIVIYTRNTAIDIGRKRKRQSCISLTYEEDGEEKNYDIPDSSADMDEIVISRERARCVGAYIDLLPEGQRHVIILKFRFQLKNYEIAEILNLSETAVSSRLDRARARLKKMMEDDGFYGE